MKNGFSSSPRPLPDFLAQVSGNGKLPFEALKPGSSLDTAFEELNIFLVSSQANTNLTVSSGPRLLTDEDGTVRHLSYELPNCIQAGQYNVSLAIIVLEVKSPRSLTRRDPSHQMTFYERSTLENDPLYVITPIPIRIRNPSPSGDSCTEGVNELQVQPQEDARAARSPFLPGENAGSSSAPSLTTVTLTGGRQLPTPAASTDPSVTTVTMVVESPVTTTVVGGRTTTAT